MNETLSTKGGHRWGLLACCLLFLLLSPQVIGEEEGSHRGAGTVFSVTINTRRPVNVLDSEFIGFYAKPQDIFDGLDNPITESSYQMAKALGRTYLKVVADSSQLYLQTTRGQSVIGSPETDGLVHITTGAWKAFYEWAKRAGLTPIFVLDYPVNGTGAPGWKPKNALRILSAASSLGINECKWQLGNGDITDGARYVEDLRTFRTMVQAFAKQSQQWDVVASELNIRSMPLEDAQYFNAQLETIVDAVTIASGALDSDDGAAWNATSLLRDIRVRGLSGQRRVPIWLDLTDEDTARAEINALGSSSCSSGCLRAGLAYARTLGEAARGGASAVFRPLHREDLRSPTLPYLIALLHKRTVGRKVFSVQPSKQAATDQTSLYAYCGRNRNATGALTVVIVNENPLEASNVTLRLSQTRTGSTPVELYLVNVQAGQPMINNRAPQADSGTGAPVRLHPVYATTSFRNGSSFYVPPASVLYAVLPGVQVRECHHDSVPSTMYKHGQQARRYREASLERHDTDRTSADALLQDLIGDIVENVPLEALQRRKRWAVGETQTPKVLKKRFPLRFPDPPQSAALAKGPGAPGAKAENPGAVEKAATGQLGEAARAPGQSRKARQTQAYKRQQRRLRLKEKRSEKRNLRKMKYPLRESMRERPKRGGQLQMHHQRRLLKRMPMARAGSPKTKRSSLAEAVNEPPTFGEGSDESSDAAAGHRSGFPLGDVHLVISKAANDEDGVDYITEEEIEQENDQQQHREEEEEEEAEDPEEQMAVERLGMFGLRSAPSRSLRHRAGGPRRRISVSQRDFRRYTNPDEDSAEEETECEQRCRQHQRQREHRGMFGAESRRIDRYMSIVKDPSRVREEEAARATEPSTRNNGEIHASLAPKQPNRSMDDSEGETEKDSESIEGEPQQQQQTVGHDRDTVPSNHLQLEETEELIGEESREPVPIRAQPPQPVTTPESPPMLLYTPAPQTSEERQDLQRLQDSWSLESEASASAEVTEVRPRFRRSTVHDSGSSADEVEVEQDIQRLEDFFRTNAKLQQKFAEMFDLLLEAIEELGEDDNDARERIDGEDEAVDGRRDNEAVERVKRNVLLHLPQSWESRERSNMIQRQEVPSMESRENYVEPQQLAEQPGASTMQSGDEQDQHQVATPEAPEGEDTGDGSRPGAYVIRTIVSFMRKASTEFHQLFSNWFGSKTS
ncbi:uncharacterized protein LOC118456262 [Anopheles albimanus]|uniref:Uncharacterized protein n=1 Tax=Anopheles albimanus TaxID=7167 RepID=A0A182G0E0_ANOAL|nr:uncharacterized protein LOC118456262 [Anopheles albimanus]